ncbi:hypothetical protein BUALT_Bualt01G0230700 [Buddleja alternifolia]|uniref:PLAC8 family protein n=1 Tax=Buddleja alternifolia TaxID=168488 RepID=A0AAV6YBR8_9LAMI|nr:hypothetical protein BUALT_Bualt01G0230700 [Buddleja alternifolia]
MASAQDKLAQMEARQCYRNVWEVDLFHAPAADPRFCCFAFWCGPCVSYILRKRALRDDMSRYTCCAGYMPCSGRCGESKCPEFCLCTEVILCFNNSVASTRFLLQDEFNIQTTPCDNCIIAFMVCVQQLACIFSLLGCILGCEEIQEAAHILRCIANLTFCTVCPCMQTQHKVEMDKRDGTLGASAMAVPPSQQMSRLDQPYPAAPVGYPYGQHPGSYPAPGYPVANPPPPYPHSHR